MMVSVIHQDEIWVVEVIGSKILPAVSWCILESSTNSVENTLNLELASESLIVDHNRWEDGWAIVSEILHFVVNKRIS